MADNPTSAKLVLPDVDMLKWISKGGIGFGGSIDGFEGQIRFRG